MRAADMPGGVASGSEPPLDWNEFVTGCDPAHFEQTSWWAAVESGDGWSPRYVTVRAEGSIAAGAMVLVRRQSRIGKVGYLFRGPLLKSGLPDSSTAREKLVGGIKRLAGDERLVLLVIVPPYDRDSLASALLDEGFLRHPRWLPPRNLPTGAVTVDLLDGPEACERGFRRSLRKDIGRAVKKGLRVESGSVGDLEVFWSLHQALCRRRGVESNVPDLGYVRRIWDEFHSRDQAWMFKAVLDGEVLASMICLAAGKWFFGWRIGWEPDSERAYPTQAVIAHAIRTASVLGFRYFDFLGIDYDEAVRIQRGEQPGSQTSGMTFFKLSFGGALRKLPPTLAWFPNPVVRGFMRAFGLRLLSPRKS